MQHFLQFVRRSWLPGLLLVSLGISISGCDATDLLQQQCTPETCDYMVNQLTAIHGSSGTILVADSNNAFYTFDASANKWNKVGAEIATHRLPMLVSPNFASDKTAFIGNSVSTDGGATWSFLCVATIGISPDYATDKTVFAKSAVGTGSVSISGPADENGNATNQTVTCPANKGAFYASPDGGKSWNTISGPSGAGEPDVFVISPTYKKDHTIFATFTVDLASGLYRSSDGGQTWSQVLKSRQDSIAISTNYSSDKTIIAVAIDAVQISTNGGSSWKSLPTPITPNRIKEIAFSPNYSSDKQIALVSVFIDKDSKEASGTYFSTDQGSNWNKAGTVTQRLQNYPAILFSLDYASDKTLYTASIDQGKGPGKSTDGGKTWTAIADGLEMISGLSA
jgi:hypothetical protein